MTAPIPKSKRLANACPECGRDMVLRISKYGPFYGCVYYPACQATHGAHPDGTPLGVPANRETRLARIEAHNAFDRRWKQATLAGRVPAREAAYRWLQEQLGLTADECHIGSFDKAMCEKVVALCKATERTGRKG